MIIITKLAITLIRSQNNTITVDQDGSEDYKTLKRAIDNVQEGDTIIINSGEYKENIKIEKNNTKRRKHRNRETYYKRKKIQKRDNTRS